MARDGPRWHADMPNLDGTGENELYDMQLDPGQHSNIINNSNLAGLVQKLDKQLDEFFGRYSTQAYDLWRGGTAKGSVIRPAMFQSLYGEDWRPRTDILPAFEE